jgi:hypothetical protein
LHGDGGVKVVKEEWSELQPRCSRLSLASSLCIFMREKIVCLFVSEWFVCILLIVTEEREREREREERGGMVY